MDDVGDESSFRKLDAGIRVWGDGDVELAMAGDAREEDGGNGDGRSFIDSRLRRAVGMEGKVGSSREMRFEAAASLSPWS